MSETNKVATRCTETVGFKFPRDGSEERSDEKRGLTQEFHIF